jgi:MFS family permease
LWFAGNGVMADLIHSFNLNDSALGHLTSAVQFGFIFGTFLFALLSITDRFSPSKVFFISAIIGGLFNLCIVFEANSLKSLLLLRFLTGFFLAGIYPVGMKIASDYFEKGLGKSLGFLVGALVVGTAFPHFLKGFNGLIPWKWVISITTGLAFLGGAQMLVMVPDGPYRKSAIKLNFSVVYKVFRVRSFRSAAFGYFGHMWELYSFWAFVPLFLTSYALMHSKIQFNVPVLSFAIIGIGGLACVISGYLSQKFGTKKTAFISLALSCLCCLLSPLFFIQDSEILFVGFLVFWGMVVIADSPLFSTLVAQNAASESKGTALTIVNSIGFAITVVSIQLLNSFKDIMETRYLFTILAIGPILGLMALYIKKKH